MWNSKKNWHWKNPYSTSRSAPFTPFRFKYNRVNKWNSRGTRYKNNPMNVWITKPYNSQPTWPQSRSSSVRRNWRAKRKYPQVKWTYENIWNLKTHDSQPTSSSDLARKPRVKWDYAKIWNLRPPVSSMLDSNFPLPKSGIVAEKKPPAKYAPLIYNCGLCETICILQPTDKFVCKTCKFYRVAHRRSKNEIRYYYAH